MTRIAIVLAGGRSERFGGDKLAAELDGATILETTLDQVARLVNRVIVAGPAPAAGATPLRPSVALPVTVVEDAEPFGGPLAALARVLETLGQSSAESLAIVVGGDMPRLVPAVLTAMLDRLDADPAIDSATLAVPGSPRRQVLPLALRVGPAVRAAREAIGSGDRALVGLVDRLSSVQLPPAAWRPLDQTGSTLIDVDTAADLERLQPGRVERRGPR